MVRLVREFSDGQDGLTLIEYALIAALIAMTMVGMLQGMGGALKNFYVSSVNAALSTA